MIKIFFLMYAISSLYADNPFTVKSYSQIDLFKKAQKELKHKNYKDSYKTLQLCEDYVDCQTMLGFFYANGLGIDINKTKSIEYFKKAINKGSIESTYNLGSLYLRYKNYTQAKKYFEIAAIKGSKEADYNLGILYIYGLGIKKDYAKSLQYMKQAKNLGYKQAQEPIRWLEKEINRNTK